MKTYFLGQNVMGKPSYFHCQGTPGNLLNSSLKFMYLYTCAKKSYVRLQNIYIISFIYIIFNFIIIIHDYYVCLQTSQTSHQINFLFSIFLIKEMKKQKPRMTTTRFPYTNYYLTIRRARNSKWQREWKTIRANYTKLNQALKSGKMPTIVVSNMRLSWVDSLLATID